MDQRDYVLAIECNEPEGTFIRHVRLVQLNTSTLKFYWDKLSAFDVLFNEQYDSKFEEFVKAFITGDAENLKARGLIWQVDDVGILYLTNIVPGVEAEGHFSFWDSRIAGRVPLLRTMLKYWCETFGLHRVVTYLPLYTRKGLFRLVESIGFVKEGRLREAAFYKGQWWDMNAYAVLESEVKENGATVASREESSAGVTSDSVS